MILDAGYKTVQNAMGNALLLLIDRPEIWQRLAADEEFAGSVVEECLRYCAPGNVMVRRASEELVLGDTRIPADSRLFLLTGAANRDPAVFDRPEEFDPQRTDNRHLTFGQGIHFCLGAPLARMEMGVGLRSLGQVIGPVELAIDATDLVWHEELILHGITALPVRRPAAASS
jgi:cytochrome P450